ncbi:MAG TPA: YitT family protein [Flavitalea sp.]|nr:YitT family protein [Flavitalea sp.]
MKSIFSRSALPWSGDQKKATRRSYTAAKQIYRTRIGMLQTVRSGVLIIIGIFSAAFGLKSFLLPNNFIDGGVTGISLLLSRIFDYPLPIIIILVNVPFIFLGYRQIGNAFTIRTVLGILGLAICLAVVNYPPVTNDKLLVAVFGGFFLGAGIGFTIRGGGVLDGTEVLAIFISRKTGSTIGDIIMVINIIIFSSAVYFLGLETALYSMLTYLSASKTVDFFIEGIEEYLGVTIISRKNNEIRQMIAEKIGRGVTIYKGTGGFGKRGHLNQDTEIVFTVVTRLEVARLRSEIEKIDDDAFVVMHSIKDTKGGMIKKRPLKDH